MAPTTRLNDLSVAITRYGDVSYELLLRVRKLGTAVCDALPEYLGGDARVLGVPPMGDWEPKNYAEARFSYHGAGALAVGSIQMGVAVRIPHLKDEGELWIRLVVDFEPSGGDLIVSVGDSDKRIRAPEDFDPPFLEEVCETIYAELLSIFGNPVRLATAAGTGKVGFLPSSRRP